MLTPFRGVEYGGSINGAKAFGRSFGLQFALGLFASSATYDIPVFDAETSKLSRRVRSVGKLWPRVSIAFDADGGAEFGVPIDLMLEYTLTHVSANSSVQGEKEREEGSEAEHVIALGVYYSGLVDLQLGVTGYASFGEHPMTGAHGVRSGDPYGIGGLFVFRYLH
jgi:hypothetical protein